MILIADTASGNTTLFYINLLKTEFYYLNIHMYATMESEGWQVKKS
jgi:hypothetical protein